MTFNVSVVLCRFDFLCGFLSLLGHVSLWMDTPQRTVEAGDRFWLDPALRDAGLTRFTVMEHKGGPELAQPHS